MTKSKYLKCTVGLTTNDRSFLPNVIKTVKLVQKLLNGKHAFLEHGLNYSQASKFQSNSPMV
jgi:hypothetical protein